jgi:hypothetical protein
MNSSIIITIGFIYFNPQFSIDLLKGTAQASYYIAGEVVDKSVKSYKYVKKNLY